jgi:hypothetical protein
VGCPDGMSLNANGDCVFDCDPNCTGECDLIGNCNECKEGFELTNDGTCV